ncbi:hypothetical protein ID866_6113 [Astraeus odoratus]|nr:hypothetical protein ID866_6113 [Astraeus odoratus]
MFDRILTKWCNQLSTENLMHLTELDVYVHEEHIHGDVVKKYPK